MHEVLIDGKEYVLNTQAEHKEGDPIPFMITKKDMEHFMYLIDDSIRMAERECYPTLEYGMLRMKKAFQHMIDCEIKRGRWE